MPRLFWNERLTSLSYTTTAASNILCSILTIGDGLTHWYVRQRVKAFQTNLALHGGSHLYHVIRVIFVLSFVFQVSSSTMWPTSQLMDLTLLWWNWILCISGIYGHCASNGSQLVLEPIRHVVSGRSRVSYSPRELKAIRTSMPRTRLPTEVWERIISLEIRKPNSALATGGNVEIDLRRIQSTVVLGIKNSNQSKGQNKDSKM